MIATLDEDQTTVTHAEGTLTTTYLVTAYNGSDGLLTEDAVNGGNVPGYPDVPVGEAPAGEGDDDDDGKGGNGSIPGPTPGWKGSTRDSASTTF